MTKQLLKFMTFNVLTSWEGVHKWGDRKNLVENVINEYQPDILCLQECSVMQANDLLPFPEVKKGRGKILTNYGVTGPFDKSRNLCARNNSSNRGILIFYNKSKLTLTEENCRFRPPAILEHEYPFVWGHFRFNDIPEKEFFVFDTHLKWKVSPSARLQVAEFFWETFKREFIENNIPAFLAGDFNSRRNHPIWPFLVNGVRYDGRFLDAQVVWEITNGRLSLSDAKIPGIIDQSLKRNTGLQTTYHGFEGPLHKKYLEYFDWILYRPDIELKKFEIVTYNENGEYPSDHYPVYTEFLV